MGALLPFVVTIIRNMTVLKIIKCSNLMYWYRDHIGGIFPYLREDMDCYITREPEGYTNIIKKTDAEKIETPG